jgi:hypothetical protein
VMSQRLHLSQHVGISVTTAMIDCLMTRRALGAQRKCHLRKERYESAKTIVSPILFANRL